ncbi:MAG: TonB-dependent receptor [Tannerellaceae bacterium]|jgi:TonB-linked SusC/RagA family outer membrane protein|nr:TonB-dependent receptor [Tannerellaceae bacterium]
MSNVTVEEVIEKIEKETNFKFVFTDKAVDTSRKVDIHFSDGELKEVLDQLIKNTGIDYKIVGQLIVLSEKKLISSQQDGRKQISGRIVDESGESMIGVNVVEQGTSNGVISDIEGKFSLFISENATLQFSYIGYVTQEIQVRNQTSINVVLREEAIGLDEVVAVGYGTKRRSSVSGAIDLVGTQTFEDRPVGNAMQALQGASPNLIIQQRNMNPNENTMNINIRGVSSMNNSDPLLVIDGMIASGLDALTTNLNPNDIENVTILKDAGSAAIYGSRSANGVILITTKQGAKNTTPKIRFSGMMGVNAPEILYRPVAGWKNAELRNYSNEVTDLPLTYTQAQIDDLKAHSSEDAWFMDQIYKNALQQSYNLSVSGGANNTSYLLSLGYFNQENNFVGDWGRERYNFRINLNTEWKRFKVGAILAYNRTMDDHPVTNTSSLNTNVFRIPQYYYYKLKSDDGKYLINDCIVDANTLGQLEQGGQQKQDIDNIIGNMNVEYAIFEGLKAKALVGIELVQQHRFRRWIQVPLYWETDLETPARYINSNRDVDDWNNKYYNLNTQFLLDFNRTFASAHNVNAMLGVSNESYTQEQSMVRWRYTDPDLGLNTGENATQVGQATNNYTSNQNTIKRSITSVFGRAGYNYDNRYYLDFTFRYDGSSKFAKNYRWGFFPSFSAAYRISEEDFMSSYKTNVGNLKVRTSYGLLGIQSVDDYAYLTTYTQQPNRYGFNNTAYPGFDLSIGNEQLSWETSANFNIGFDATFFNNSFDVTFDWFKKRTYDILLTPVVPMIFGTSNAGTQNLGEMQNVGWEATIGYQVKSGGFSHRIRLNIADAKNKVTDFGGKEQITQGEETWNIIREGEALGSYYGYKSAGLFQSQEEIASSALPVGAIVQPGDVKYVDTDGNGVINELDRRVLGNAFPRYTFGFTYDIAWKGFDFNILIQGVGKRLQQIRGEMSEPFHHLYWVSTMFEHQLDFWTPDNPDATLPRLATDGPSRQNNYQKIGTDIILYNMAYLRVKNIRLGYTLPKKIFAKAGIGKAHISANVQNPFTFSKNSWADPESTNFGNNMGGRSGVGGFYLRGNYPLLRYYGVSIDLEF